MSRQCQWRQLKSGRTARLIRAIDREYKVLDEHDGSAPYHMTLPIMCAMYDDLQGDLVDQVAGADQQEWDDFRRRVRQFVTKRHKSDDRERLRRVYPVPVLHDHRAALELPVRAIGFFSWERERRVFLARRLYPYYLDFLSYSQCLPGWGTLGRLLERYRSPRFLTHEVYVDSEHREDDLTDHQRRLKLLPYLNEIERLDHQAALAWPIGSGSRLDGAFVFFVQAGEDLPVGNGADWLRDTLRGLRAPMKRAIDAHKKLLSRVGVFRRAGSHSRRVQSRSLAKIWREWAKKWSLPVVELKLTHVSGKRIGTGAKQELWWKAEELIEHLPAKLYAVIDGDDAAVARGEIRILVASPDEWRIAAEEKVDTAVRQEEERHFFEDSIVLAALKVCRSSELKFECDWLAPKRRSAMGRIRRFDLEP